VERESIAIDDTKEIWIYLNYLKRNLMWNQKQYIILMN